MLKLSKITNFKVLFLIMTIILALELIFFLTLYHMTESPCKGPIKMW
jgi:hypothetical protein